MITSFSLLIQSPCGQAPPPCLGQWGQTANQQTTNKPANQRTNRPTSQQSKKLKHTKQQDRLTRSWLKNRLKIEQKLTKNPPEIHQNLALGGSWGVLWDSWRGLGRILAPRATKSPKSWFVGPPWPPQVGPNIDQKLIKIRSGGLPKRSRFLIG